MAQKMHSPCNPSQSALRQASSLHL